MGTGPKRARPRLLRIRNDSRRRPASRQRKRKGASEGSERATACAHEGESIVKVLSKSQGRNGMKAFLGNGIWRLGRKHPGNQPATFGSTHRWRFLGAAKRDDLMQARDFAFSLLYPQIYHHAKTLVVRRMNGTRVSQSFDRTCPFIRSPLELRQTYSRPSHTKNLPPYIHSSNK